MTDADFYAACLERLDELVRLGRLIVQAATAGAWAAGAVVGLLIWRLVVAGSSTRWPLGLLVAASVCMNSAAFGQVYGHPETTGQVLNFSMSYCGGSGSPYGATVVTYDISLSGTTGDVTIRFAYIDLPSPYWQETVVTDGGSFAAEMCKYICYYTAYPPAVGTPEWDLLKLLRLHSCGEIEGAIAALYHSTNCGSVTSGNVGEYLPDATCQNCFCYGDMDFDGVPDHEDPAPNDPTICGDSNGDSRDDCADDDGDGVANRDDPAPGDPEICGDWNDDGVDDCAPCTPGTDSDGDGVDDCYDEFPNDPEKCGDADGDGEPDDDCETCLCNTDEAGNCCGVWDERDHGSPGRPIYYCVECGCVDDPETDENECPPICVDDPETEEDECACFDDPLTEVDECYEGVTGDCPACALDFSELETKLGEVLGDFDFLPRTLEVTNHTFVIQLRFVNPLSGTPLVPLDDTRLEFDYLFLAVDASADIRSTMDGFRVAFRAFALFVVVGVIGWKLMAFTLGA